MKIIKELWHGNLQPVAKFGDGVRSISELERIKERNREKLLSILGNEKGEILEKYTDCIDEYISSVCEQAFYEGFCVGAKMCSESLLGADEIIKRDCCL
ncbi:MAG: hypothetical protein J6Q76_04770 [Clostridia bacterium]|nr:hypothetical protein [Clostridia bacterium]